MYLECIDALDDSEENHEGPNDDQWRTGHPRWAQDDDGTGQQDERRADPVAERQMRIAFQRGKRGILVDGAKDEDTCQDVHQGIDEHVGIEGEYQTQDDAAQPHDGEGGRTAGNAVALSIVHLDVGHALAGGIVGHYRHDARQEEQHTNEDGNPRDGLLTVFQQQGTDDDGA